MEFRYTLLLILYYIAVVIPHEYVGVFLANIFLPDHRAAYNWTMLIGVILIITTTAMIVRKSIQKQDIPLIGSYFSLNVILAILCVNMLFVLNVEVVHFIQYAVFAILCFQVTKRYYATAIVSTFAGAGDELFQYVVLTPDKNMYYDFNDVIINAVGVGFGLILMRVFRPAVIHFTWRRFFKSPLFSTLMLFFTLIIVGFLTEFLSYGPDDQAAFVFLKDEYDFWFVTHPNIKFHIVKPIEAIFILLPLIIFYSYLEKGSPSIEYA